MVPVAPFPWGNGTDEVEGTDTPLLGKKRWDEESQS